MEIIGVILRYTTDISFVRIMSRAVFSLQGAWMHRHHPNMKFIWFEDMKNNLISTIRDVSTFLNIHLTELKILQIDDFLYIDNIR